MSTINIKKEFLNDLKRVYSVVSKDSTETELLNLNKKWAEKYPVIIGSWQDNWESSVNTFSSH